MMSSTLLNGSRFHRKRLPTGFQLKPFLSGENLNIRIIFFCFWWKWEKQKGKKKKMLNSSGLGPAPYRFGPVMCFSWKEILAHTKTSFGLQWWWWGDDNNNSEKKWDQLNLAAVFLCLAIAWIFEDPLLTNTDSGTEEKQRIFIHTHRV